MGFLFSGFDRIGRKITFIGLIITHFEIPLNIYSRRLTLFQTPSYSEQTIHWLTWLGEKFPLLKTADRLFVYRPRSYLTTFCFLKLRGLDGSRRSEEQKPLLYQAPRGHFIFHKIIWASFPPATRAQSAYAYFFPNNQKTNFIFVLFWWTFITINISNNNTVDSGSTSSLEKNTDALKSQKRFPQLPSSPYHSQKPNLFYVLSWQDVQSPGT